TCACSTADQTRERLRARLAKGETPESIIDEYVAEYGTGALAIPPDKGAMKAIYVAPLVAIALGGLGLVVLLKRWRANEASMAPAATATAVGDAPPRDEYDDRIDAALKELDDA